MLLVLMMFTVTSPLPFLGGGEDRGGEVNEMNEVTRQ